MASVRLPLLQVLRGVAALLVVAQHAQAEWIALAAARGEGALPGPLLPGNAGVDVFFVISGFIIVHASADLFGRPGSRSRFAIHRIARVVPLYWLATTLVLLVGLAVPGLLNGAGGADAVTVAASYAFLPFARPDGSVQPLYSLGWTLNYEMAFYALVLALLGLPRRPAVALLAAGLGGLALAHPAIAGLGAAPAFWSEPIVLEFGVGALLGLARTEGLVLPGALRAGLAGAGLVLLALAGDPPAAELPRWIAWGGPAALLVAAGGLAPPGRAPSEGPGARLLRAGIALGNASYALYLVHPFAIRGVRVLLERQPWIAVPAGATVLIGAWLAILAALVVHRRLEIPMTRGGRRRLEALLGTGTRPGPPERFPRPAEGR